MKKLLTILLLLISLSAGAATYYIKTGGNDLLAGTSIANAWASLTKVNATTFAAGDSVLFNRGDTFRGALYQDEDGTNTNWIYYGAYGTGAKPKILGSKDLSATGDWTNHSGNIWKTTATLGTIQDDISNLIFNNEASCGYKKKSIDSLNVQGKFFYNRTDHLVYLYSASNPGTFYTHIEAAGHHDLRQGLIYWINSSYIKLENLDVRYSSAAGIEFHTGNCITVESCEVSWIGGEWMNTEDASLTRLGNGISFAQANDSIIVRGCKAHQCFDAGISPQAWSANAMTNMWFYNNIITNCYYSYEVWCSATYTLTNVHFYNNTCVDAGDCWSYAIPLQRGDNSTNACHVMSWSFAGTVSNVTIRNNIFVNSANWAYRLDDNLNKITVDNNVIVADTVGYTAESTKYVTLAAWVAAMSQDAHSIDDDPLFVSTSDFNLQTGSPAKDIGMQLGLATDYAETTRGYMPDAGAYEIEDIRVGTIGGKATVGTAQIYTIRK